MRFDSAQTTRTDVTMSTKKHTIQSLSILRRFAASLSIAALLASSFALGISAQNMTQNMKGPVRKAAVKLTEDQRILHVLNRLGFGARPGDLERVKAVGVDNYINQQLSPEKIDDSASEVRLQNLGTLRMSTAELYEKYPQPGQLLRQLQQRGALPGDLAQARDNRVKGVANAVPNAADAKKSDEAMSGAPEAMQSNEAKTAANNNPQLPANPQDQ